MEKIIYKLSPSSGVEKYFLHQCERSLLYNGLSKDGRRAMGFDEPKGTGSEIAAQAGQKWEQELANMLIQADSLVYVKDEKKKSFASFDAKETLAKLAEMVNEVKKDHRNRYLYQGSLATTPAFIEDYFRFDKSLYDETDSALQVQLSRTHPDLIRVAWDDEYNRALISIVDVKLARKMKVEHKLQVSLYVKLLTYLLEDYNSKCSPAEMIDARVDKRFGYLWNYNQDMEKPFLLQETEELLQDFFTRIFPDVIYKLHQGLLTENLEELQESLELRVGLSCEWCENYGQCTKRQKAMGGVALLPYLSSYAQEYARKLNMPKGIREFIERAQIPEVSDALSGNRTWSYLLQDNTLFEIHKAAVPYTKESIEDAGYSWKGVRSFTLSTWQDFTIILTAQKDVATGRVYAVGYYVSLRRAGQQNQTRVNIFVVTEKTDKAYYDNGLSFVGALYSFLHKVDQKNEQGDRNSLQGFVMDSYERNNLEELLYDLLDYTNISASDLEKVMAILFWIQGERLVTDSTNQPDTANISPLIVISSELKKLIALPIPIAYNLRSIMRAYKVYIDESMFIGGDTKYFGQISDALPPDIIHDIWNTNDSKLLEELKNHLTKRFHNEASILFKLQNEGRGNEDENRERMLTGRLESFRLPGAINRNNDLIKRWEFEARYEELLQYSEIRRVRQQSLEAALESGDILRLRTIGVDVSTNDKGYPEVMLSFLVENGENFNKGKEWFSGLLVKADEESLKLMYGFSDWNNNTLFPRVGGGNMTVLNFMKIHHRNGAIYLSGKPANSGFRPESGDILYISNRYADINSGKIFRVLESIDNGTNRELLQPEALAHRLEEDITGNQWEKLLSYSHMDKLSFTPSQEEAFENLSNNSLTVLQGPPGTGKTDFIARAIISLCRYYKEEKQKMLRVLISANSHAAIENALFAISGKMNGQRDISIFKAGRFDGEENVGLCRGVRVLPESMLQEKANECQDMGLPMIVGATNWSCDKMSADRGFDVIIIDEASQVRVMDAMLALSMGNTQTTRYLLVGDDDQLPPIIQGKYAKEPEKPYVYGSVFRFYRDPGMLYNLGYCKMLEENFRMNDILARYSAEKIYSEKYKAFNENIGRRHLEYGEASEEVWSYMQEESRRWCEYVLDQLRYQQEDYWPLIFCHIKGGNAKAQIEVERYLVAELTAVLRDVLGSDDLGKDYSDQQFWQGDDSFDGVYGIISPHHQHIEKLKDAIVEKTGMQREDLYIGTVDKLQGQQRDAVVVSYGVTDIESAVVEGEFIYSRNRLNVSLTRAKCKTIVMFSDVMTSRPLELLSSDDEDLQKGAEYVCGFLPFMCREEDDSQISKEDFIFTNEGQEVTVTVYRKRLV